MRSAFFLVILAALGVLTAGPAPAQPQRDPGILPLDRILPGIRATRPGQFYDADGPTQGPDGQEHYHLKWMSPDGRVEWLDTDARTGRVLNTSPGRDAFDGPGARRLFAPAPSFPTPRAGQGEERREFRGSNQFRGEGQFRNEGQFRGEAPFRGGGRGGYDGGGRGRRDR